MNVNERMIQRITTALRRGVTDSPDRDDASVLKYIREELRPDAAERRAEKLAGGEAHLIEVANQRLKPYEPREVRAA